MKSFTIFPLLISLIAVCNAQNCYVCHEQETNDGKCATTVEECDYGQDHCLSEVGWGSTPFWEIGAPMQHYISKKCATFEECQNMSMSTVGTCERIWWRD